MHNFYTRNKITHISEYFYISMYLLHTWICSVFCDINIQNDTVNAMMVISENKYRQTRRHFRKRVILP